MQRGNPPFPIPKHQRANSSKGPNRERGCRGQKGALCRRSRFVDRAALRTCHDLTKRTNGISEAATKEGRKEGREEGGKQDSANYPSRVSKRAACNQWHGSEAREADELAGGRARAEVPLKRWFPK